MATVALAFAVIGALLGITLLFRPDRRVRLVFYACILVAAGSRVIMAQTQGMALNWLDAVVIVALVAGIGLEIAALMRRPKGE